jgi:hypothetical protein
MDGSVNQPGEIIRVWMVLGLIDADKCAASHSVNWLVGGKTFFHKLPGLRGIKLYSFFLKKLFNFNFNFIIL